MSFDLTQKIKIVNPTANLDELYGVYPSISEALTKVPKVLRSPGRTLGVLESGSVEEYWFKNGIEDSNLVKKITSSGGVGSSENINRVLFISLTDDLNLTQSATDEEVKLALSQFIEGTVIEDVDNWYFQVHGFSEPTGGGGGGSGGEMTPEQIKIYYESNPNTNEFNDAEKLKLSTLENYDDTEIVNSLNSKVDKVPGTGYRLAQINPDGNISNVPNLQSETLNRVVGYTTNNNIAVTETKVFKAVDTSVTPPTLTTLNEYNTDRVDFPNLNRIYFLNGFKWSYIELTEVV